MLTPDQFRQLAAATHRKEQRLRELYSEKRRPLDSTLAHVTEHAARLGYPLPPQARENGQKAA